MMYNYEVYTADILLKSSMYCFLPKMTAAYVTLLMSRDVELILEYTNKDPSLLSILWLILTNLICICMMFELTVFLQTPV